MLNLQFYNIFVKDRKRRKISLVKHRLYYDEYGGRTGLRKSHPS